jgi:hypothetical protein
MGLPFQCVVPWRLLSLELPEAIARHSLAAAMRNLSARVGGAMLTRPAAVVEGGSAQHRFSVEDRMRRVLLHFRRDLLWTARNSRVAENVLLDAARWRTLLRTRGAHGGCCPFGDETRAWDRRR